ESAFGSIEEFVVDINDEKLKLAEKHGAIPVNSQKTNARDEIKKQTGGRGADVAIEMIGLPQTQKQAIQSVGPLGRVVLVGLSDKSIKVKTYSEILGNEVELIGSNDHRLQELPALIDFVKKGMLDTSSIVTNTIPLQAAAINETLDELEHFGNDVRTVIVPD